jgi:hypothetical protein
MASWASVADSSAESSLISFILFAIAKLNAAEAALTDEDDEDNYEELCTFSLGLSRNLKSTGAGASAELKGKIREGLLDAWDIRTDKPASGLKSGGVPLLRAALLGLLAEGGALEHAVPAQKTEAAAVAGGGAHRPENLSNMSFQDALVYMWTTLDKADRLEWGDNGFVLGVFVCVSMLLYTVFCSALYFMSVCVTLYIVFRSELR